MDRVDSVIVASAHLDKFCESSGVSSCSYQVRGLFYLFFGLFVCFDNLKPFMNLKVVFG